MDCFVCFVLGLLGYFFIFFLGVVPKSQGQVEEEGAFWPDATGPDTLLYCLRAAPADPARELCTGKEKVASLEISE